MKVYQALAAAIVARNNCIKSGNALWEENWTRRIRDIEQGLPSGSGIDCGTKIVLPDCTADKLVLLASYHHMHPQSGMYDGWTEHVIVVRPTFSGIALKIGGRNRNDIKDYLHEVYHTALTQEYEEPVIKDFAPD